MRRMLSSVLPSLALAATLLVSACSGKPLPPDKADYAGVWRGPGIELEILAEGRVRYEKVEGKSTTTISGPLQGFHNDDFVVGVMVVKTTFHVEQPPQQVDGVWTMTVDGRTLTREP